MTILISCNLTVVLHLYVHGAWTRITNQSPVTKSLGYFRSINMAMHIPTAPGFAQMLKEGARHFSGLEEAVYRNIDACKELATTTESAYGPNGMNKMIINHIEKLFVTSDAATILRELEVQHPAAKMLVLASQMQEQECGDGTNFTLILAGALLGQAGELLRMGLSVPEVISGYKMALSKVLEVLPGLVRKEVSSYRDRAEMLQYIKSVVMSKQYGYEDDLAPLITDACISILNKDSETINVDHIRVCKILGSGLGSSHVVKGMMFKNEAQTDVHKVSDAKVAVYSCPVDSAMTETKGTVLIKSAQELTDYSKGEEDLLEKQIADIAEAGVKLVISGGKIGDMALHFLNKYRLMAVRLTSKWDLRRLCKALGATALPRLVVPSTAELGFCSEAYQEEIGETAVTVFKQDNISSPVATIVIRASTDNTMDDIERCIDDGVNCFKALTRNNKLLCGAGAVEMQLAKLVSSYGETCSGLEQYAIVKYADALRSIPRALAANNGMRAAEIVTRLSAAHQKEGNEAMGVHIEDEEVGMRDVTRTEPPVYDSYLAKEWAIKFATNAACTVLQVDQIIMAKAAGGPKPRENKSWDNDD